jgi:uncharacterized protein YndB with AHSA1/START domain
VRLRPFVAAAGSAGTLGGIAYGAYFGLVTGRVTLDLGVGRRTRPLGPLVVDIDAPPAVVYDAATAPYAERRPRAMQEKVHILGRTDRMVLAAHHTPVGKRLTAVTVETVTFEPPQRIDFRLLRGPVPHVTETFALEPTPTGTRLTYTGHLGTDLGRLGSLWGDLVAQSWIHAVETSLAAIKTESERRTR